MSIKLLSALIAIALLNVSIAACGSQQNSSSAARHSTGASTRSAAANSAADAETVQDYTKVDRDRDNDNSPADDTNNNDILESGHAAGAADERAVAKLLERYYTVAAAANGAAACSMLYVTLAESVAEDHGHGSAGPAYLSEGSTCAAVMSLLFKHFHTRLAAELPLLKVARVRLKYRQGIAILSFGRLPERQISVRQERHTWKVESILDSELP